MAFSKKRMEEFRQIFEYLTQRSIAKALVACSERWEAQIIPRQIHENNEIRFSTNTGSSLYHRPFAPPELKYRKEAAIMKPMLKEGHAFAKIDSPREAAIGPTKTPAGVRTLYVGEQGMAVVQEWLDYQKKNDPIKYESRFLFPSNTDAPLRDDVLNTRFYRLKRKYEDKLDIGWNLYRFRHTFATNLAEANVPIKTAMRLMGDSTTNVILGVYTHVRNDEARKAGEKINQVYTDMLAETDKPNGEK